MTTSLSLTVLESPSDGCRRLGLMLLASLVGHGMLFLLVSLMQWTPALRPFAAQEVTLVSLQQEPHPHAAAPVHPKAAPPVTTSRTEEPPPPVRATPVPAAQTRPGRSRTLKDLIGHDLPAPPPATASPASKPDSLVRELMRGVELPPEAPKLSDPIPASTTPSKTSKGFESSLKNLSVPNAPKLAAPPPNPVPAAKPAPPVVPPSLNSLVTQALQKSLVPAKTAPPPVVAAKSPAVDLQKPALEVRAQGSAPGQNRYLAIVQQKISQYWTPTDVQATSQSLQVRIKFRLASTGAVSNVGVERSSGVPYYDLAGERAILSAVPLPPFPPDFTEAWLDVHISFTVGEGAG